MKILHLASFSGNIGDVANHSGFYSQFSRLVGLPFEELEVTQLEMRKFYYNHREMHFDKAFVNLVNDHNLFIIGGGNFFELCWDYSNTGTTFDISTESLEQITTPIYVNAIGIDDNKGVSPENIAKFKLFLDTLKRKGSFFTVRNDGSIEVVEKYFQEYKSFIHMTPDHGFFIDDLIEKNDTENVIGFNIAVDMKDTRYKDLSYEKFLRLLGQNINQICQETNHNIIFFPHIISDYQAILDALKYVDNLYVRTRVSIAPLVQNNELKTFEFYSSCKVIFAMRFHANVCALSMKVPVIPILSYFKHIKLYEEIKKPNWVMSVNNKDFEEQFNLVVNKICNGKPVGHVLTHEEMNQLVVVKKETTYNLLGRWLKENLNEKEE